MVASTAVAWVHQHRRRHCLRRRRRESMHETPKLYFLAVTPHSPRKWSDLLWVKTKMCKFLGRVRDVKPSLGTWRECHPTSQLTKRLQVEASVGRRPDRDWVRSSGRPRNRWIDQLRQDHQRPPADLWRAAIRRGHTGATLRSSTTTRWRRRRRRRMPAVLIPTFLFRFAQHLSNFLQDFAWCSYRDLPIIWAGHYAEH